MSWTIRLFGEISATYGDLKVSRFRTSKTAMLLAYLAIHPKSRHPREVLSDLLWPDDDGPNARLSLRVSLSALRSALSGPPAIESTAEYIRCIDGAVETDIERFRSLIRSADSTSDVQLRLQLLQDAIGLHVGEVCPGSYEDWVITLRNETDVLLQKALREVTEILTDQGKLSKALPYAQRQISLNSLDYLGQMMLIKIFRKLDDNGSALRQLRDWEALLFQELGEELPPKIKELERQLIEELAEQASNLDANNINLLPRGTGLLFGRDDEVPFLLGFFHHPPVKRLVSIVGFGGIGKTKIATAINDRAGEAGFRTSNIIYLRNCVAPCGTLNSIFEQLYPHETPAADLLETLIAHLSNRKGKILITLDNAEHLADEIANFVSAVLQATTNVSFLVTSRKALGLPQELVYPLPPLAIPKSSDSPTDLRGNPAMQFFADRALNAEPMFKLDEGNIHRVAELCQLVEGIPLAIELAASWCSILTLEQVQARIKDQNRQVIVRLGEEHPDSQSLNNVLESSLAMTSPEARHFFGRFAIFIGGWSLEAAEAVCGFNTATTLKELQRTGLLTAQRASYGAEMRYSMLEIVRNFALTKLSTGEAVAAQKARLQFQIKLAKSLKEAQDGPHFQNALKQANIEFPNVRAAIQWALSTRDESNCGDAIRLVTESRSIISMTNKSSEALVWIEELMSIGSTDLSDEERAEALHNVGNLNHSRGFYKEALKFYRLAETTSSHLSHPHVRVQALMGIGHIHGLLGQYAEQESSYLKMLEAARARKSRLQEGAALASLAHLYSRSNRLDEATAMFTSSVTILREVQNYVLLGAALFGLSITRSRTPQEAIEDLKEAQAVFEQMGHLRDLSSVLCRRARLEAQLSNTATAFRLMREAFELHNNDFLESDGTAEYLCTLAEIVLAHDRNFQSAFFFLSAAQAIRQRLDSKAYPDGEKINQTLIAALAKDLGSEADGIWLRGQAMPTNEVVTIALSQCSV